MSKASSLRKKYPLFEYKRFNWKLDGANLNASWEMQSGELKFHPELTLFKAAKGASELSSSELDNLIFHLGLADIFSYWKATCSPVIKISAGKLDQHQLNWWKNLLIHGMGQYFYENQIDYRDKDFIKIACQESSETQPFKSTSVSTNGGKILVPIGGGKDSAVTLELLCKNFGTKNISAFAMNVGLMPRILPAVERLANAAGVKLIKVHRKIDPALLDLNHKGFLNGHTPFTAYLSFLSVLTAKIFGYENIAFSNERSSNEGNVDYLGSTVNHQYSKSFEFEENFRTYNNQYLSDVNYFSFLRPLYELQILKIFSVMKKYFLLFRSCNRGTGTDSWCGKCPKCLAAFVGLYPFVEETDLIKIFGHNLFSDPRLLEITKDLLGKGSHKPFECVGTYDETRLAFHLSLKKYGNSSLPQLLDYYKKEVLPKLPQVNKLESKILAGWDENNNLPANFNVILADALKQ